MTIVTTMKTIFKTINRNMEGTAVIPLGPPVCANFTTSINLP